jgi:hypothetical protein
MSAYKKQVDKDHAPYVWTHYEPPQVAVNKLFKVEKEESALKLPQGSIAQPDSPINKEPELTEQQKVWKAIPSIPMKVIELVREANLSKVMKNKVQSLPKHELEQTEKIEELVELLEKKQTFKKSYEKVFNE